jgi:LacI family transcriptional regulator
VSVATIGDVARRSGVSKTTVSHALSGKRPVAPSTQSKVLEAVEALSFRPNGVARSLRMKRSHTVALLIPDITNPYYPMLARGLQDAIIDNGYHLFLCNTDARREQEVGLVQDALQRQVDGIAIASFEARTGDLKDALEGSVPLISIGPRIDHANVDVVWTDDARGAAGATRHLLQRGHRAVGMIGGTAGWVPSEARLSGYLSALNRAGITFDPALLALGDFTRRGGADAMTRLMGLATPPTAVFCANDLMALGAMDVARDLGLAIPGDVALVGYDDIEAAALVTPALTTVLNPAYEMGRVGGRLLLERAANGYRGKRRRMIVPHRLIRRESA